MSYQNPTFNGIAKLATTGINYTVTGLYPLFTVPSGRRCYCQSVVFDYKDVEDSTGGVTFDLGAISPLYTDILAGVALSAISNSGYCIVHSMLDYVHPSLYVPTGNETIKLWVTTPVTATRSSGYVNLFGTLF